VSPAQSADIAAAAVLEITLRTPVALAAIAQIARQLPEVVVGVVVGTVLRAGDALRAREAQALRPVR
jgi:2-dehydro-3-deoxyphosphogluconate aldolase/(4S)-4-hydroxy-2-oxoglutarate aldolase